MKRVSPRQWLIKGCDDSHKSDALSRVDLKVQILENSDLLPARILEHDFFKPNGTPSLGIDRHANRGVNERLSLQKVEYARACTDTAHNGRLATTIRWRRARGAETWLTKKELSAN